MFEEKMISRNLVIIPQQEKADTYILDEIVFMLALLRNFVGKSISC